MTSHSEGEAKAESRFEQTETQLPNFDRIAERTDLWVPHLSPVSEALLDRLPVAPEDRILDIACGTGEPGLSLARRCIPGVVLVGVDSAPGMVSAARRKATGEGLNNIEFLVMQAEKLDFPDNSFNGVLSRFGLMLLENPRAGCQEMLRVLQVGGHYAVAVWDEGERNTIFFAIARSFAERLPAHLQLPIKRASQLAGPDVLPALLKECGASQTTTELFAFDMKFSEFQEIWRLVQDSGVLDAQLGSLPVEEQQAVREDLENQLAGFKHSDGYLIPHICRLVWGR